MERLSFKVFGLVLLSLVMTACSVNKEIKKAPSSKENLGFIVIGVSGQQAKESGLDYRVVNENHGLVEIYSSEDKVKEAFPESLIEKNQIENQYVLSSLDDEPQNENDKLNAFIADCDKEKNLSLLIKNEDLLRDPISQVTTSNLGEALQLEAVQLDGNISPDTRYYWILANVGMALYDKYLYEGKNFDVKLTGVGQYQLTVIAKDKNNVCGISPYLHWVTSNEPIKEDSPDDLPTIPDADHLEEAGLLGEKYDRSNKIIVAVIDTGVNYNHPGLNQTMYRNEGEIPGNGADDDGNGFVDDYSGYDFFSKDPHPMDDMGHGSHVAGLIAGINSGVTSNALILPIKVGSGSGIDSASLAGAILYAVDQDAKVINVSLGGYANPTSAELMAYDYAKDNGVLLIIASGNGHPVYGIGLNIDRRPVYPASLGYDNMIVVSASSKTSKPLTTYSNFGSVVDIVAPGGDSNNSLYSAAIVNNVGVYYTPMSGTSMAAPIVAGAAAEILSINDSFSPMQVKAIMVESGTFDKELNGLTKNSKHLNMDKAIELAESL